MNKSTKEWKLYEAGIKFNNRQTPSYYDNANVNLEFFNGNQWKNVKSNGMPTPVFNIIKRGISFFVSSLMSNNVKIQFTPLQYREDQQQDILNVSDIATSEIENLFDKFKMENRCRDALFDAAITGDCGAHMYFNPFKKPYGGTLSEAMGEIEFELVDGANIYFGNPNNHIINTTVQPYIIISGRDTVANLKREAEAYKQSQDEIKGDDSKSDMLFNSDEIEIEGKENEKATYIIMYKYNHETNTIFATKCTQGAYMYQDIDTGLSNYPVSWLVWEKQKNDYHGNAICTSIIPNQIFINRMFAMCMYHLMMAAFPKAVYDADKIQSWTNEIGKAIPVRNLMPGESMQSIATYLEPGNMSNQIVQVLELAIQYTKECLGVNEAMMGDINPEQSSGKAIIATVNQSVVPLENVKANYYEWMENNAIILLDMMSVYYGERPLVVSMNQEKRLINFDFSILKDTYLNCKSDVGPSSYWSELASIDTLSNLFEKGAIDIIEYLDAVPNGYIPKKQDLINKIKARMSMQMSPVGGEMPGGMPPMGPQGGPPMPPM